jgi:hypothetical protein
VPGSHQLANASAKPPAQKPSIKKAVAAKAGKMEGAAAAAAKHSAVVEGVEKKKRGRPRKQPLNDITNEVVATSVPPVNSPSTTDPASTSTPTHIHSITNNNRARALQAAAAEEAAKAKEAADEAAKQAAKGWFERTVNGATVVTLVQPATRSRKPTRLADGSVPQREVKGTRAKKSAPLDPVEKALLTRTTKGNKRKRAATTTAPAKKQYVHFVTFSLFTLLIRMVHAGAKLDANGRP